jgi:hypothetical protein
MPRNGSGFFALLLTLLAFPAFAEVADGDRLISQLPPPDRVLAAIPPRDDARETAVLRLGMLQEFSRMAQSLGRQSLPRDLEQSINQYWQAALQMQAQMLAGEWSQQQITAVGETVFPSPKAAYQFRRKMFSEVLDGDLRAYALGWHDSQPDVRAALGTLPPEWLSELPPELRAVLDKFYAQSTLWFALLITWLVVGIALGTTPFHLLPDDPWTLQRGRRRRRMEHRVGTVMEVREAIEEQRSVRRPVDQHGAPTGPDQVSITRFHHMKMFMRSKEGEHVIKLTDQPFDARAGQRVLEVYDARAGKYLFLYNYDLKLYLPMPRLRGFVKMRPWILLPVWALASLGALKFAPVYALTALWATPLVYLVLMGFLNGRRRRKFMREFAPKMVATTSAADSGHVGNADYGISQA